MPTLEVDAVIHHSWQEAVERRVQVRPAALAELAEGGRFEQPFSLLPTVTIEPLNSIAERREAAIVRSTGTLSGRIDVLARRVDRGLFQITVQVGNTSRAAGAPLPADEPGLQTLVSTHVVLTAAGSADAPAGQFVSAIDPPERLKEHAAGLRQEGLFPILVGQPPDRTLLLASPIILYDYPEVAAESPGDLFDATEIDEILGLRIMTLTDDEKAQIDSLDERTRAVLLRTHLLPDDERRKLHGTIRGLKHVTETVD